ncbi:transducer of ERBB2 [Brevipalpus obovatus]|uniref:transducer of ERBB2 n=1 Tax=Brevipalpus obovatus TaxID=246614 RepID=UPI003D9ECF15
MHVEIQVALNFLISFLYNKLPRRRVNQFGEELENALKLKFDGHWYPEKPFKGSAFRCLKTTPPLDPVFEIAARESGMDLIDIQENLPQELSIWIDPGEVSYRMSEKGPVKILYSESDRSIDTENPDREVIRTFNPEAQCFKPIESTAVQFGGLSLSANGCSPIPGLNGLVSSAVSSYGGGGPNPGAGVGGGGVTASLNSMNGGNIAPTPVYKPCPAAVNGYHLPKSSSNNVTFTTATFAQTKFGSTKLKSNSKRSHRMSPTEFSNYIKQREMIQQQQAAAAVAAVNGNSINGMASPVHGNNGLYGPNTGANNGGGSLMGSVSPHNSRSISPIGSSYDSLLFGDRLSSMVGKPSVLPLFNGGGNSGGGQSSLSMANGGNSLSIRSPSSRFSPNTITDDLLQQSLLQNALHSSSSHNGLDAIVNGCQFSDLLGSDLIKSSNTQGSSSLSPSQISNNVLRFSSLFDTSNNNSNTKQSSQSTLNGNLSNSCSSSRNPFNGLSGSSLSDSGSASSSVSSSPPSSSSLLSNGASGRLTSGYESTVTSLDNSTSGLSSMMGGGVNNPIGSPLLIPSSMANNSNANNTFESTSISSSSPLDTTSNGTNSTTITTSNAGANGSSPSSTSEISDSSSPLLAANSSKGFDSISFNSNGVYPNQYQHLLVAN